jgi:hypothetical protein
MATVRVGEANRNKGASIVPFPGEIRKHLISTVISQRRSSACARLVSQGNAEDSRVSGTYCNRAK